MHHVSTGISRLLSAAALSLFFSAGAQAQSHYVGGFNIADLTQACGSAGWADYEWGNARIRPAGQGSNPADFHQVSFFHGQYAWHLRIPSNAAPGQWVDAAYYGIGSRSNTGRSVAVRLIDPLAEVVAGNEIMLRMNIANWETVANCDVTVSAFFRATQ